MSLLTLKHIFGVKTSHRNSIEYLNEYCYVYPSNRHIIFYNKEYKNEYFIDFENENDQFECLLISPNKEYLSIGFSNLNKSRIILYKINQIIKSPPIKLKTFSLKNSHQINSVCFSSNSKYLLVLSGTSEHVLTCWSIPQSRSIGTINIHINSSTNPLHLQISFNPINSSNILISGNDFVEEFHLNNGTISRIFREEFSRYSSSKITAHCWLNESHMLIAFENGFLCILNKDRQIIQQYYV
ncbi:unnamed protein product [Adineta ricciae]|nr:unnamed protein product [Adineta ricciae]